MTLILTELSPHGIAMAADSAVTVQATSPVPYTRYLTGMQKLQPVYHLQAGVSTWGHATVDGMDADVWLASFIQWSVEQTGTLGEFAVLLQGELRRALGPGSGVPRIGFHLAGYEEHDGERLPSFYHIHDGPSETFGNIDPQLVNANHDMSPARFRQARDLGVLPFIVRNGDYTFYVNLWNMMEAFFKTYSINLPARRTLDARLDYLTFQVRTVGEIYRLLGVPSIGGAILGLTIGSSGLGGYFSKP